MYRVFIILYIQQTISLGVHNFTPVLYLQIRKHVIFYPSINVSYFNISVRRKSSVSIATELRPERSGIESRWEQDFPPIQTGPGAHPASCKNWYQFFPGDKEWPRRDPQGG